jgi:CheY-like chemotaxis protein
MGKVPQNTEPCVAPSIPICCTAQQQFRRIPAAGWLGMSIIQQQGGSAKGARVLVVEDEAMIRMLLEDMLGELGFIVAAQAARVEEALEAAKTVAFDVAILDVNLNGQTIVPVAEALDARGMPFVFATGYGELNLPEAFRDRPTLKKPFQMDGLVRTLEIALGGGRNARA